MTRAPIALAMDTTDLNAVRDWTGAVAPHITTVKVGLELYLAHGGAVIDIVREQNPALDLFLDLKLHDIPNTVAGAARAVARYLPKYLTVHALGGASMIRAAADESPETLIAAVTILTSHAPADLNDLGIGLSLPDEVARLAETAVRAGAGALVCSPHEVRQLRALVGPDVHLITPGVRPAGAPMGDQQRVSTPQEALRDGSTLLVIGRPITGSYEQNGSAGVGDAAAAISSSLLLSQ